MSPSPHAGGAHPLPLSAQEALTGFVERLVLSLRLPFQIAPEEAQRLLKDNVFSRWSSEQCEDRTDTLKMVGLVDFFLPFFPMERRHVGEILQMRLKERRLALQKEHNARLSWRPDVVPFLSDKVGSSHL